MPLEQHLDLIRRDFSSFSDPASEVLLEERMIQWSQGRKQFIATLLRPAEEHGLPDISFQDRKYSYREFFASAQMGDLRSLAETVLILSADQTSYVEGRARSASDNAHGSTTTLLTTLCTQDLPYFRTRVLFLQGSAGSGKTMALRHLARHHADAYVQGRVGRLYLYVDAQGRSLARLDEAISLLLDDLGARFNYHAVTTLTRLGLIVPIIDGFDELLGIGGYREAFSSLTAFLARLRGEGVLIASARSTFYSFTEFRRAAELFTSGQGHDFDYEIVPVEILPWNESDLARYLEASNSVQALGGGNKDAAIQKVKAAIGEHGHELLSSPFYVSQLVKLIAQGELAHLQGTPARKIVGLFVMREVDKLRDQQGGHLLSSAQHFRLLSMLAEEMWWQETRVLDADTVRTIAELACEEFGVPSSNARAVITKITSYAFLAESVTGGAGGALRFEHEYYYAFFLGRHLASLLLDETELDEPLSHSLFTVLVGDECASALVESGADLLAVVERIGQQPGGILTREVRRANIGVLIAGLIRGASEKLGGSRFRNAMLSSTSLAGTHLREVLFQNCDLVRVDLRTCNWSSVRFESCTLSLIEMDAKTTFSDTVMAVPEELSSVVIVDGDIRSEIYRPSEIVKELVKRGATSKIAGAVPLAQVTARAERTIALLSRLLRLMGRIYYLSDDDLKQTGIGDREEWPELRRLLEAHSLIREKVIVRRGPNGRVLQLTVPPNEIESGGGTGDGAQRIAALWRDIEAL